MIEKLKDSIKVSLFLLIIGLIFTLVGCSMNSSKKYSFAMFYEGDTIPEKIYTLETSYDGKLRKEMLYLIDSNGQKKVVDAGFYYVNKGLYKVSTEDGSNNLMPYLSILNYDCIDSKYTDELINDLLFTSICYEGEEDLEIQDKIFHAYKFTKRTGLMDGVTSTVYYDKEFIKLKEEYVSGYAPYFKLIRTED